MWSAELQTLVERDDMAADLLPGATKDIEVQKAEGEGTDIEAGTCMPHEETPRCNSDIACRRSHRLHATLMFSSQCLYLLTSCIRTQA